MTTLVVPTPTESNPWVTTEECPTCHGRGLVFEWDDRSPCPTEVTCEDCDGEGTVRRDWLREAFLVAQERHIPFDLEAKHLQIMTQYYRRQVSALTCDVPDSLARIAAVMETIGTTLVDAGKEAA